MYIKYNKLYNNYATQRPNACSGIWSEWKVGGIDFQRNPGREINQGDIYL